MFRNKVAKVEAVYKIKRMSCVDVMSARLLVCDLASGPIPLGGILLKFDVGDFCLKLSGFRF
jgi:hypothetical protein